MKNKMTTSELKQYVIAEAKRLHKIEVLKEQKSKIDKELKMLSEGEYSVNSPEELNYLRDKKDTIINGPENEREELIKSLRVTGEHFTAGVLGKIHDLLDANNTNQDLEALSKEELQYIADGMINQIKTQISTLNRGLLGKEKFDGYLE